MPGAPTPAAAHNRSADSDAVRLAVGVGRALWRWRLELTLVVALVLAQVLLAGVVGGFASGLLVGTGVVGTLMVPTSRAWLLRALRAARVRRAWWRAWTDCELPRVRAGRVPRSRPARW